ncbi:MAG: hypothetical protein H6713_23730 [Myxococcales bacterium]|nr:hypothetical protein [Myxococcales bacterium]
MSPPPLRALAVALVSALVAIAVTDWLALDLLHHELLDRPLRAYATPSCFAALDLWAPRFWLRLGLEDGLRWGRWLHVCFAIGGLLLCRLALPRPLSRDAARSLTALLLTSALLLLAPVITGAVALREQLYALLTPLGPGRWYTTPGAPTDVFTVARQHVLMSTSLAAVQLTLLSAGAAATAALGLRRRAALDPRDAWALLAASAPALMAFGALAYVQIEFVVNCARPRRKAAMSAGPRSSAPVAGSPSRRPRP